MTKAARARSYNSSARKEAAQGTRRSILASARQEFLVRGYAGTTMAQIANGAGVALDTVYATTGKKPMLFRLLVETAISGGDEEVPADRRDYVRAMRAEPDAAQKLRLYAAALRDIQPRLAPLFRVLQAAAPLDANLSEMWREIAHRRAANMRLLATELATTGQLREELTLAKAADIIWSMNSPEFYLLLVEQRGWSAVAFERLLGDAWIRLLLRA